MRPTENHRGSASRDLADLAALGTLVEPFELKISGPTEVVATRVTLEPGEDTGWHFHPGEVLVVVESGALTHRDAAGNCRTYRAGEAFVETGGAQQVHIGCNLGSTPVALHLTYLNPAGGPLSVPVAPPAVNPDRRK